MDEKTQNIIKIFFCLLPLLFFSACSTPPGNVPFPGKETEFIQPLSKKLKFSGLQKIKWGTVNQDSVRPITTTKLDLNVLPSHPIGLGGFSPLIEPIPEKKLNWKNLPSSDFHLNNLLSQKLRFKTSILGQPKRVKAGLPTIKEEASQDILIYGFEQGLPGTTVQGLLQDKNGIMWFGTANGVCRFDGEYCDIFSIEQGISHTYIKGILEDSQGQIWIAAYGSGVDVLNMKSATIKHLSTAQGLINNYTLTFLEDKNGSMWIGTEGGISIIDEKAGTIKNLNNSNGLSKSDANIFLEDNQGKIWIGTDDGIDIIDENSGTIKYLGSANGLSHNDAWSMATDNLGKIWIGFIGGGVEVVDEIEGTIKYLNSAQGLSHNDAWSIVGDNFGKMWIGTSGGGINIIDEKTSTIKRIGVAEGLSSDLVNKLYKDNHGQIWAGTFGSGGADVINESTGIVAHLSTSLDLKNYAVSGLLEDSTNCVWIGSWGNGLDIINKSTGLSTYMGLSQGLINNAVMSILVNTINEIWIGTHGNGIQIIDKKMGVSKNVAMAQGLNNNFISCLLKDSLGQIWIGTDLGGVNVFNSKSGTIKYISSAEGLSKNDVRSLLLDSHGRIWVGTDGGGVNVIDQKSGTIKHLSIDEGLSNNYVGCLFEDDSGNIWMGTGGGGLYMIDEKAGVLTNFTVNNGLSDMSVFSIREKKGKIFAGTSKGLSVIIPVSGLNGNQKWLIKTYGTIQGFPHVEFQNCIALTDRSQKFWWAVGKGVTIMDEPLEDSLTPSTYVTGLNIMDQPQYFVSNKLIQTLVHNNDDTIWSVASDTFYLKKKLPPDTGYLLKNKIAWTSINGPWLMPENLVLPYDQNHLTFYFTGGHLDNRDKTRYRYILEGNDKTWSSITDQAFGDYRNLNPGNYIFKICSMGFNGIWSKPATFSFTITPPWWQTWWAYCLYALIAGSIIYTLYRNRINQLEKTQAAQIKAMVATQEDERKRISRDLHDDVGTKLSALKFFLSSLHEKASHNNDEEIKSLAQSSEQFITEAMQDVRQLLLNLSPTILEEFGYTTAVEGLVNKINETKQINFSLVVFGMKERLQKDYELALYRITQELINNVLKHAEAKHVSLQIGHRDEKIILMIEDDGRGFDTHTHKDGYGLNNLTARTKLMQGTMIIDSKVGKGTSVLIEIPYNFNET